MPSKTVTWDHFFLYLPAVSAEGAVFCSSSTSEEPAAQAAAAMKGGTTAPQRGRVIRACSLTDCTWSPSPSVAKVAASAVLFGEGACRCLGLCRGLPSLVEMGW